MSDNNVIPFVPPGDIIRIGGLVDESSASLCFYGADLEPEEVSGLLGIEPTKAFRRGFQRSVRVRPSPHGAWFLEVRGEAPTGPDDLLRELLAPLPRSARIWSELTSRFKARIFLGIHIFDWNRGFSISPDVIADVAALGLDLDFDIYANGADDDV